MVGEEQAGAALGARHFGKKLVAQIAGGGFERATALGGDGGHGESRAFEWQTEAVAEGLDKSRIGARGAAAELVIDVADHELADARRQ